MDLATIRKSLLGYGFSDGEYLRFMESVSRSISSKPGVDQQQLSEDLRKMGWAKIAANGEIIASLQSLFCDPGSQFQLEGQGGGEQGVKDLEGMSRLIEKIYTERGFDFRHYAKASLNRRFLRRLLSRGVSSYQAYMELLDRDEEEYDKLFNEAVVRVTRFLRNEKAFAALNKALETKLKEKTDKTIRIWSAGCCTGQEPYTVAMQIHSLLGDETNHWRVEIIATDIDHKGLDEGEKGYFSKQAVEDIPPQWLENYFSASGAGYLVSRQLKEWVTFTNHNLVSDAGLSELDIIVCRNVLIYFEPLLQVRILERFADGLNDKGLLLLGRYEMLMNQARNRFSTIDFDARLYRKKR